VCPQLVLIHKTAEGAAAIKDAARIEYLRFKKNRMKAEVLERFNSKQKIASSKMSPSQSSIAVSNRPWFDCNCALERGKSQTGEGEGHLAEADDCYNERISQTLINSSTNLNNSD
jgi:hypothetical protein